ncbi:MAG: HAMP domain-containing sensor histidine kinase [Planctomycetota bacterium]|nr:HAMP domain-containing sensor histidine kinase [Planctomycetota bacterium]
MGRVAKNRRRRRGVLGRPLLVFALLLLGPAIGFCVLGWESLANEQAFRVRDMHRGAQELLTRRINDAAIELERIQAVETGRDYYQFQREYMPQEQVAAQLGFQHTELNRPSVDSRVRGWFSWELHGKRIYHRPDVFPESAAGLIEELSGAYGAALSERLRRAPADVDLRMGRGRKANYSQRVVAANEERGALQEDIELQRKGAKVSELPYLDNFNRRAREDEITVRYSPFRYLARAKQVPGPALIAWRIVWIPADLTEWREVKQDRWLIQGYVIDPRPLFPSRWETIGASQIVRGDQLAVVGGRSVFTRSLSSAIDAESTGVSALPGGGDSPFSPELELAARADLSIARAHWRAARARYLFLVAGLVFVVVVGFFVLIRGVRREVVLAQRKEDFIAAITHELKTPLTGIRMYADMLRAGWVTSPEAADTYAERILEETERLGHLVEQVLDLAALERGVAKLNAQPGDLREAVRGAVALMSVKADQAGVALSMDLGADVPEFAFDPRLVRPMILNLLDNAIKYSARATTKEVTVGVRREGERVILSVADRGIGIDPKSRKIVFEPFQRAGDEMTRQAPGVGIGLALVKRYAEAHSARIQLTSEPGQGTTVEVRFRLA